MSAHTWMLIALGLTLVVGALAAGNTILHTFAVAIDVLAENIGWNRVGCITLSSRAAIAARHGRPGWSMAIGFLFGSWPPVPKWRDLSAWCVALLQHGEDAIPADADRNLTSLETLYAGKPDALAAINVLRG
ncbi:MAG: hypothetical protein KGH75_13350, partial [Rhodospirillales bacterium]|nr:hypothetical protein [Rhodospirillales bacterium]